MTWLDIIVRIHLSPPLSLSLTLRTPLEPGVAAIETLTERGSLQSAPPRERLRFARARLGWYRPLSIRQYKGVRVFCVLPGAGAIYY
jgi:hypothetical protein